MRQPRLIRRARLLAWVAAVLVASAGAVATVPAPASASASAQRSTAASKPAASKPAATKPAATKRGARRTRARPTRHRARHATRRTSAGRTRVTEALAPQRDAAAASGYTNPVYANDAPDPYVLDDGGSHTSYYAFTTGGLFPVLHSPDLVSWSAIGSALRSRPAWAQQSGDWHPWAPSVLHITQPCPGAALGGCYVMYYVALSAEFNANCVAVATSTSPAGPYTDRGPLSNGHIDTAGHALGCGDEHGYGMIDPSPFLDPATGRRYLYASEDFACPDGVTVCDGTDSTLQPTISVIPLSDDGMRATGPRAALMSGDPDTWESATVGAPTVEGPNVLAHNGLYYLLYSGGNYRDAYGMGYATAQTPTGPFTRGGQILVQTPAVLGPGGGDTPVIGPHGGAWMVYHGRTGSNTNPRTLRIDPFSWRPTAGSPDAPVIAGPTSTGQPGQP